MDTIPSIRPTFENTGMALWTQLIHQIHVSSVPSVRWDYILEATGIIIVLSFLSKCVSKGPVASLPTVGRGY